VDLARRRGPGAGIDPARTGSWPGAVGLSFTDAQGIRLGWPAAVALGVVAILAMSLWETISRPWKVRQAFEGERARLLHAGWAEEDANMAARAYFRQKFNLQ
jgi:hypothetical protein